MNLRVQDLLTVFFISLFFLGFIGMLVFKNDGWFYTSNLFHYLRSSKLIQILYKWYKIGICFVLVYAVLWSFFTHIKKKKDDGELKKFFIKIVGIILLTILSIIFLLMVVKVIMLFQK